MRFNDFEKLKELEGLALKGSMDTVADDPPIAWLNDYLFKNFLVSDAKDGSSAYWQAYVKKADTWMKTDPKSPTAPIVYAEGLKSHAWAIRGGGYANTVSNEQWAGFREYMSKADNFLAANKGKSSVNPAWYTEMYSVAQALGWSHRDYMDLVREATERYPSYEPVYTSPIVYMLPQWGGSFELIERHARDAVKRTKTEHGNALYALIYASLMTYSTPSGNLSTHLFKLTLVDWPTLNQGFKDFIARKKNTRMPDRYAWLACLADDKEATASALQALDGKPDKNVWPNINRYVRCQRMSGLRPDYDAIYPDLTETDSMSVERMYALYIEWVNELFQGEEFAKLEQIYAELNSSRKRFPSGEPMLIAYWQGIIRTMQEAEADSAKWQNIEAILTRWLKTHPESVVANMMSGYQYFMRARHLHLEASGSAGHRLEQMKDKIGLGYLSKAKEVLERNKTYSDKDILWHIAMMEIGRFQAAPRAELEQFYLTAAKRDPYLWIIYFCAMRELMPYWGEGDALPDELEKHAQAAVGYTKEKEGEALYALVYREYFLGDKTKDIFAVTKVDWSHMKRGFEDLNSRYPSLWNLNSYAFFACMAKDKSITRELLKKIAGKPVERVWSMVPAMYYRCTEWAKSDE